MSIIAFILALALCLWGKAIYKTIVNPISMYNGSWSICLFASSVICSAFGGYAIRNYVYLSVMVSCICFSFASLPLKRTGHIRVMQGASISKDDMNYRLIILLNIIATVCLLPDTANSIKTFMTKGMYYARLLSLEGEGTAYILKTLFRNGFILPIYSATIFIATETMIFNSSTHKKKLLMLAIFDLLMYTITVMGRWLLLKCAIYVVLITLYRMWLSRKKPNMPKNKADEKYLTRVKRGIVVLLIGLVALMVYITSHRMYGETILQSVMVYFGGSLKYLDLGMEHIAETGDMLFGSGLFAAIWDIPLILIQKLLGIDFLRPLEVTYLYNNPVKMIGPNITFTGFGTVLMSMYLDGRFLGIVLESLLLGRIAAVIYRKMNTKNTSLQRNIGCYTLLLLSIVTIQWDGLSLASMMTYVFLVIFFKRYHIRIKRRR